MRTERQPLVAVPRRRSFPSLPLSSLWANRLTTSKSAAISRQASRASLAPPSKLLTISQLPVYNLPEELYSWLLARCLLVRL